MNMPASNVQATRQRGLPKRFIAIASAVVVVALLWASWGWMNEWGFRRALPWNAEDVQEWSQEDGFLPDYRYLLRAKISKAQFDQYVDRFALTPHTATRKYSQRAEPWLRWRAGSTPETSWWDPSDSLAETFVRQAGDTWTFAKYERGYLYLKSLNH